MTPSRFSRRAFLVRAGVVGTAVAMGDALTVSSSAEAIGPSALAPLFDALAFETINGLVAFVVPGPDAYSVAQQMADSAPGGIDAKGTAFMLGALDDFFPIPAEPMRMLVQAFATALSDSLPGIDLGLLRIPLDLATLLDEALQQLLGQEGALPLSALIALMLNLLATLVNPESIVGPFTAPFSNLSFDQKIAAFRLIEEDATSVVALLDTNLPEPLKESLSGLLAFLPGALLEFTAFGVYGEFSAFDPQTRQVVGVPVGWQLSNYLAGANFTPVEGWNEFKGYLGGRTSAQNI